MQSKGVFTYNADINKTAYMNWRMDAHSAEHNLAEMGNGFFLAAECLLQNALDNNRDKRADVLVFPILYSIDQGIEVYLKAIICLIELIASGESNNYTTHNILQLFREMKSLIKKKEKTTKGLDKHLNSLSAYSNELVNVAADKKGNPKMDFARYPFDTDGTPHFYVSFTNTPVDMECLLMRAREIKESLDSLYTMYSVELDQLMEQKAVTQDNCEY